MLIINSTLINHINDLYYYADNFPLPYEDDDLDIDLTNRTYYDDYILNINQTFNLTNSDVIIIIINIFIFKSIFIYYF